MPYLDTLPGYEASSGPIITWEFPHDRLEETSPVIHKPAAVLSRTSGRQITGTIIVVDDVNDVIVLNVAPGAAYRHQIRNVLTYNNGVEATWGVLNNGDCVYYDRSATMPAGVYLSTSPLDNAGAANPLFGHVVWDQDEVPHQFEADRDPYPTGTATVYTYTDIAVMQTGVGGVVA